jgi:hypothetical protein
MKIKDRFKKALFAFFKDEILKNVGYNGDVRHVTICETHLKFTEIKAEILFDDKNEQVKYGLPTGYIYEKALESARTKLFEETMKYVIVDKNSIIDQHLYTHRAIRLSLFVGIKND